MRAYVLSCESTVDLTKDYLEQRNISYICYPYELDGISYWDDLGRSLPYNNFYQAIENGTDTKTAQINSYEFEVYFEEFLKAEMDVVHLCLSSGITGIMNSAVAAQNALKEHYPERYIYLIDPLGASSGFGLLMNQLAYLRDGGMDAVELVQWADENKLRVHHWYFSEDLKYYIRGGRISKTAGMMGTMLGICPLLNMSSDGRSILREKIRSKKCVIAAIVDKMALYVDDREQYAGRYHISYSGKLDSAMLVMELVEKRFTNLRSLEVYHIGTIIGSHSGLGTVALFFWGDDRTE